jgi:hypothetical protein
MSFNISSSSMKSIIAPDIFPVILNKDSCKVYKKGDIYTSIIAGKYIKYYNAVFHTTTIEKGDRVCLDCRSHYIHSSCVVCNCGSSSKKHKYFVLKENFKDVQHFFKKNTWLGRLCASCYSKLSK